MYRVKYKGYTIRWCVTLVLRSSLPSNVLPIVNIPQRLPRALGDSTTQVDGKLPDVDERVLVGAAKVGAVHLEQTATHHEDARARLLVQKLRIAHIPGGWK